ncbi:hypothetical protein ZWY2020_017225 [Hordeum vulgare]|nr:hypothetical protein ZWY2020_017225 [Hordeum vulgare]
MQKKRRTEEITRKATMRYHINLFLSLPVGSLESLDLHGEASSSEAVAAEADALDLHHCRAGATALGQAPHGVAGPVSSSYGPTAPGAAPRDAEALHRRAAPAAVESSTRLLMERPPDAALKETAYEILLVRILAMRRLAA